MLFRLPTMASLTAMTDSSLVLLVLLVLSSPLSTSSGATQLNTGNLQETLSNNELVFVNFYADWCRFSQMFQPIFEEASTKVLQEHQEPGKIVFAKVDCDSQTQISQQYKISKYPTLKLIRHGRTLKREYRGQRSVDALANYIRTQLNDPVHHHQSLDELGNMDKKKRVIIGYFESLDSANYKTYQKTASILRDDCEFHSAVGAASASERATTGDQVVYRPPFYSDYNSLWQKSDHEDERFNDSLTNHEALYAWITDKCTPLVREITFQNAEELTEEGLPFMILFHHPDDADVVKRFHGAVTSQLGDEKNTINCLTADGTKFTHPLHHLGKGVHDLPILAIDSFRHMYIFKSDVRKHIDAPAMLKNFLADLQTGKLHREFHHGPDPDQEGTGGQSTTDPSQHIPKDSSSDTKAGGDEKSGAEATTPPESTFAKLKPSNNRYTIVRDEL